MTTPERLRRRQRIEGSLLVVIGILMLLQSAYFTGQDRQQQECLQKNFVALSEALDVRSELTRRETAAAEKVNLAELEVSTNAEFVSRLRDYEAEIEKIQRLRRENPLPPYPAGRCGEGE